MLRARLIALPTSAPWATTSVVMVSALVMAGPFVFTIIAIISVATMPTVVAVAVAS